MGHLNEKQLAERWSLKPNTLAHWRVKGMGPKFVRLGRRVAYPESEVLAYEQLNTYRNTVEHLRSPASRALPAGSVEHDIFS